MQQVVACKHIMEECHMYFKFLQFFKNLFQNAKKHSQLPVSLVYAFYCIKDLILNVPLLF
jgi:hypothetical protein